VLIVQQYRLFKLNNKIRGGGSYYKSKEVVSPLSSYV